MEKTMRALKLFGPREMRIEEIDTPQPDGNRVIIKVNAVGICGSDLHMWEGGQVAEGARDGLILGHELAGSVVDPGARADLNPGDRVTFIPIDNCGDCEMCNIGQESMCRNAYKRQTPGVRGPGCYSDYYAARPDLVRRLPDTITDHEAAMIEPSAVTLHGVRLADINPGDTVFITGAGVIGALTAAWARISGASYIAISEPNELRAQKARDLGDADEVFDAKDPELVPKLLGATKGGFTKAIDCSASAPGINTAIMVLRPQSRLVLVGISFAPVPINILFSCLKEIELKGDIAYPIREFDMTMDLIARKKIDVERFISRSIGMDECQATFEELMSGTCGDIKILLKP